METQSPFGLNLSTQMLLKGGRKSEKLMQLSLSLSLSFSHTYTHTHSLTSQMNPCALEVHVLYPLLTTLSLHNVLLMLYALLADSFFS